MPRCGPESDTHSTTTQLDLPPSQACPSFSELHFQVDRLLTWGCGSRVARSSFSEQQCAENIVAALQQVATHIPKKWDNVQAVYLKTSDSVALPLYQVLPESVQRITS